MLNLKSDTDPAWLELALARIDEVLVDHAHCEHKAAVTALAFVSRYPDDPELVLKLSALAAEEATHLERVAKICVDRGLELGHPQRDPYVKKLLGHARKGELDHRIDRLLVCALIEARSCERLKLLAEGLEAGELKDLYTELWTCEAGHHTLFVDLAVRAEQSRPRTSAEEARARIAERLATLATAEAEIVSGLPLRPAIH